MKRKLIIGIVAVLVLGVCGFLFWRERSKENQNSSSTAKTTATTPDTPDDASELTDPTEGGKYLLIKEWGVKLGTEDFRGENLTYLLDDRPDLPENERGKFIALLDRSASELISKLSPGDLDQLKGCVSNAKSIGMVRMSQEEYSKEKQSEYFLPATIYAQLSGFVFLANTSNGPCPQAYGDTANPRVKEVYEHSPRFSSPDDLSSLGKSIRTITQ